MRHQPLAGDHEQLLLHMQWSRMLSRILETDWYVQNHLIQDCCSGRLCLKPEADNDGNLIISHHGESSYISQTLTFCRCTCQTIQFVQNYIHLNHVQQADFAGYGLTYYKFTGVDRAKTPA